MQRLVMRCSGRSRTAELVVGILQSWSCARLFGSGGCELYMSCRKQWHSPGAANQLLRGQTCPRVRMPPTSATVPVKPSPVASSTPGVSYLSDEEKKRLLAKYKGKLEPPKPADVAELAQQAGQCKMQ